MATTKDVPVFGNLAGTRVLSTGSVVAQPFAAYLMAEEGATVIHVESTISPDTSHRSKYMWENEHKNELCMSVNFASPDGQEVFFKLIKWAEIWMESSKGGTYRDWGLTDEVCWKHNPALVIVHISGFGQSGLPEYVERASYDAIGQAFSGYFFINGMPEPNPPMRANPYTCDYVSALFAHGSTLAALIHARQTGKGESIDIAQFEVMAKIMAQYYPLYLNDDVQLMRNGNADPSVVGYDAYKCGDGNYVFMGFAGGGVMKRGLPMLGLDKDPDFPPGTQMAMYGTPAGDKLQKALENFCISADAETIEKRMMEVGVPCSRIFTFEMSVKDPHYKAREVFVEWDDPTYGKLKGVGVIPRLTNNPGRFWRAAPAYGQDNDDLLKELGFSEAKIRELYEKGAIKKG